jgi:hypothetical protein
MEGFPLLLLSSSHHEITSLAEEASSIDEEVYGKKNGDDVHQWVP